MTIPTLSTLPVAPARTDPPATFVTRADSFLAALVVMQGELNTSIGAMNIDIAQVNADAISAAASATAAANASNASAWVSGTTYALGDVVYSPVDYQSYRRIVAGAGATDPSADATNWTKISAEPLPTQTGNSGKYLTTDGTDASWDDVESLPTQTGNSGKYLTTDGTDASWDDVESLPSQAGNSGKYLTTNGTATSWGAVAAGFNFADKDLSGFTEYTFTGIPAGTRQIFIGLERIKSSGSDVEFRIGSGSIDNSGTYSGMSYRIDSSNSFSNVAHSDSFRLRGLNGEHSGSAILSLVRETDHDWGWNCQTANSKYSSSAEELQFGAGGKSLSGSLDRVLIRTSSGSFPTDAKVSISYL